MSEITLETLENLGIKLSKDDIIEGVIERVFREVMVAEVIHDEYGDEVRTTKSKFADMLQERIIERTDKAIDSIALKHVFPDFESLVEQFKIQPTNAWGEPQGEGSTFLEYLTKCARDYLQEPVNYKGNPKSKSDSYGFNAKTSRLAFMIDEYLQYQIENAMKEVMKDGNKALIEALKKALMIKLSEIEVNLRKPSGCCRKKRTR